MNILKISNWWGGKKPGYKGYKVKDNGDIVYYNSDEEDEFYHHMSAEELQEFKHFLLEEEKILTAEYNQPLIFDKGETIVVCLNGETRKIKNERGKLYTRVMKKIKSYNHVKSKIESLTE